MQVGDQASESVQADPEQQADPAKALNPKPIHSDPSDVLTVGVQLVSDLPANNGGELKPDAIHSGQSGIVIENPTSSSELKADRGETSDPDTIVGSDLDAAVTKRIASILGLNFDRSEFLEVSQQTEAHPGTIAEYADDTPATFLPGIEKYRVRKFAPIGNELDDDGEAHAAWELAPFYVVAVLLVFPLLVALKTL